jgi:multisubunit Na+/H+ antiporter MnhC subunit
MPATDLVPIAFVVVIAIVISTSLLALATTAVLNYRRNKGHQD